MSNAGLEISYVSRMEDWTDKAHRVRGQVMQPIGMQGM